MAHQTDATPFLNDLEDGRIETSLNVPLFDRRIADRVEAFLDAGLISARRMATALNASFEQIDETFAHHGMDFRIGL